MTSCEGCLHVETASCFYSMMLIPRNDIVRICQQLNIVFLIMSTLPTENKWIIIIKFRYQNTFHCWRQRLRYTFKGIISSGKSDEFLGRWRIFFPNKNFPRRKIFPDEYPKFLIFRILEFYDGDMEIIIVIFLFSKYQSKIFEFKIFPDEIIPFKVEITLLNGNVGIWKILVFPWTITYTKAKLSSYVT